MAQLKYSTTTKRKLFLVVLLCEVLGNAISYDILPPKNPNRALYGHSYMNITNATLLQCLLHCSASCACLSFQICGNVCQLCSSSKVLNPEDMQDNKECTNYCFLSERIRNQQICNSADMNCCMTSHPCENGGTCHSILPPNSKKRYSCTCPPGYQGKDCKTQIKSCRGYANRNREPGTYTIIRNDGKPLKVFCDFDNITSTVWTLVQSYELSQNFAFTSNPLWNSSPFNTESPSWKKYRLSYDQMKSIQQDSTKWRVTCKYDTEGPVDTDYIRGRNDKVDILLYNGNCECVDVEYVNVRGESCANCTACIWQANSWTFVLDASSGYFRGCSFNPTRTISCGEDNFGYYACVNSKHRCTANQQATTQTWFGAN